MTTAQTMHFKAKLETKRRELGGDIHTQTADLVIAESEHDTIDLVQAMNRQHQAVSMLDRLSSTLSSVDRSLRSLSEGCYGVCIECDEPIGLKRLEAIPWASYCVGCQETLERHKSTRATEPAAPKYRPALAA